MTLEQFTKEILLEDAKNELDRAIYLCFYFEVCGNVTTHTIKDVVEYFCQAGLTKPNPSRLLNNIRSSRRFVKNSTSFKLHIKEKTTLLELYESKINIVKLETNNEVLDEHLFVNFKNLYPMVLEMNAAYKYGIYDGCEVLMRRIFENLLIMVYENYKIESAIKSNGTYKKLGEIIKDAESNTTLNLSRAKSNYKKLVEEFNTSAHNRYYMATKQSIDDLKHKYKVSVAELVYKANEEVK